ncbi:hypothetical protein CHH55_04710 [Niallia circulans]|uniref:hypothetical protein n=1 Tax=Niallia TaxID=2837506 RepID=UPI000BA7B2C8|nr:hypothetical protein [Niallia circulans]PAD89097.1 hypothetical protein CHH55_04710 [Niallia circulans]PAE10344.1 hypothetical protein CHI02_20625 [Niallia circulans]
MENKRSLYIELVWGSIGMLIISLVIANALLSSEHSFSVPTLILGFALINGYIFFLEKRAGLSQKVIWTQSLILVCIFIFYIVSNSS